MCTPSPFLPSLTLPLSAGEQELHKEHLARAVPGFAVVFVLRCRCSPEPCRGIIRHIRSQKEMSKAGKPIKTRGFDTKPRFEEGIGPAYVKADSGVAAGEPVKFMRSKLLSRHITVSKQPGG